MKIRIVKISLLVILLSFLTANVFAWYAQSNTVRTSEISLKVKDGSSSDFVVGDGDTNGSTADLLPGEIIYFDKEIVNTSEDRITMKIDTIDNILLDNRYDKLLPNGSENANYATLTNYSDFSVYDDTNLDHNNDFFSDDVDNAKKIAFINSAIATKAINYAAFVVPSTEYNKDNYETEEQIFAASLNVLPSLGKSLDYHNTLASLDTNAPILDNVLIPESTNDAPNHLFLVFYYNPNIFPKIIYKAGAYVPCDADMSNYDNTKDILYSLDNSNLFVGQQPVVQFSIIKNI